MEFTFNEKGDYKTEFIKYVDQLWENVKSLTTSQRMQLTKQLTECYFNTTCKMPDGKQLDRLSSFVLYDELSSMKSNKSKTTEYNVLSERQLETRKRGEADFKLADQYGTDGIKHGSGKRNKRTNVLE